MMIDKIDYVVMVLIDGIFVDGEVLDIDFEYMLGDWMVMVEGEVDDLMICIVKVCSGFKLIMCGVSYVVCVLLVWVVLYIVYLIEKVVFDLLKYLICLMLGLLVWFDVGVGDKVEVG